MRNPGLIRGGCARFRHSTIVQAQRLLAITYRRAELCVGKLIQAGILAAAPERRRGGESFLAMEILRAMGVNPPAVLVYLFGSYAQDILAGFSESYTHDRPRQDRG